MLSEIKGIGPITENKLKTLGIYTKKDLIEYLPKKYIDLSVVIDINIATEGQFCLFEGEIIDVEKPFKKGNLQIFKAIAKISNSTVNLIWFNHNFMSKTIKISQKYMIYGKLKINGKYKEIVNPICEIDDKKEELFGVQPIYWTKNLIPQKTFHTIVQNALSTCEMNSVIGEEIEGKYELCSLRDAYKNLHNPKDIDIKKYRERVYLEKIVRRICAYKVAQATNNSEKLRKHNTIDFSDIYKHLPYLLTESQTNAIERITNKISTKKVYNAILCGDVGSGKTIVALICAYFVIKNGYKVAFMAPTEILAKQHEKFAKVLFSYLGLRVYFLSSSTKNIDKISIAKTLENGDFDLIIGTHSVLNSSLKMNNLGLIIVDEQHRFGVAQRTALLSKGTDVDVLTLSATPIPRSIQLIAYGELDYITIERRFSSAVKTLLVGKEKRHDMWQYIDNQARSGNKIFIVAPRIFDDEGVELESVESIYDELCTCVSKNLVGCVHGKMSMEEKDYEINAFLRGEKRVLISTTVIEVGIDVPDAGIMVIMNAEQFGLATLHQLRGRVGRDGRKAYCFLYTEKLKSEGLEILCNSNDGFEIAERDFDRRGAGEIFGLSQSGVGTLAGLNVKTLKLAKKICGEINVDEIMKELESDIKNFSLTDVSLT